MDPMTEVVRHIYCESQQYIIVGPEDFTSVCIKTVGEKNQKHFGKYKTVISPKMARELGNALISCANEIDRDYPANDNVNGNDNNTSDSSFEVPF